MKILILSMYFHPEPVGIAPMATDLADFLAENGWDVTVVAGMPKLPAWEVYEGFRGKWLQREKRGKVNLIRTWVYVPEKPKTGLMKASRRVLHDCSIALTAFPFALSGGRPDVILTISPPLQLPAMGIFLKKWWRCPVVNWIQDIVPDAALNVGMMQEGRMIRMARKLEQFVYRNVDRIAVISEGFENNLIAKGVPKEKLFLLTNWADVHRFGIPSERNRFREQLGVRPNDFVMIHAGSLAAKQVMENVVRAMKLLEAHRDIYFFMLGDGIRKAAIQEEIQKLNAPRCHFLPTTTGPDYVNLLRAADLLVLNQSQDLVDALVPSKLLTYLPAERPVIAAVNEKSEAARFVRKSGCGIVVEAEAPEQFAAGVIQMKNLPDSERSRMAAEGNCFVRKQYEKNVVLNRLEAFLQQLASRNQDCSANACEQYHS